MNLQEVNLCFEVLNQRERLIAMLALTAGMRPGEILALQWKHIRPDHIEVVQRVYHQEIDTPKTKHSAVAWLCLRRCNRPSDYGRMSRYRTILRPGYSRPNMGGRP